MMVIYDKIHKLMSYRMFTQYQTRFVFVNKVTNLVKTCQHNCLTVTAVALEVAISHLILFLIQKEALSQSHLQTTFQISSTIRVLGKGLILCMLNFIAKIIYILRIV